MIPVTEARQRILAQMPLMPAEWISIAEADGRVLAEPAIAQRTQPPADLSAMDGYAVLGSDVAQPGAVLTCVGESAAGHGHEGAVKPGECVRIFTGAPLPAGTDTILIQEDTDVSGRSVTAWESVPGGTYVRRAGLDFRAGETGLVPGRELAPRDLGLLAAMNVPWVGVRRRPRIALLSTGDELVRPGEALGPNQIVSSNAISLAALVRRAGAEPVDIGIAPDRPDALAEAASRANGCDMLVTLGGASVGDHDLVQDVLANEGLALDFWRIAMRPGKPLMFGQFGDVRLLGLPGNPVSAVVCGLLFLRPAIRQMLGADDIEPQIRTAMLGRDLPGNDRREDYLRSELRINADGQATVTPFARQDSSMLHVLSRAGALAIRAPHAPALSAGSPISFIPLNGLI
ncbi:MAG: molybdopterin molybdotransferase MoeA [Minwuia sp.]|nr:molybdopterin molybdotransferase MoeA [Minwuia sp.]